jgi:hypothetical protein
LVISPTTLSIVYLYFRECMVVVQKQISASS